MPEYVKTTDGRDAVILKENEQIVLCDEKKFRVVVMCDDLDERVDDCFEESKSALLRIVEENMDYTDADDVLRTFDNHEIVDSNVPIHCKNISDLYYLYDHLIDAAYEEACGEEKGESWITQGIYYYLQRECSEHIDGWLPEYMSDRDDERDRLNELFEKKEERFNELQEKDTLNEAETKERTLLITEITDEDENAPEVMGQEEFVEPLLLEWMEAQEAEEEAKKEAA